MWEILYLRTLSIKKDAFLMTVDPKGNREAGQTAGLSREKVNKGRTS